MPFCNNDKWSERVVYYGSFKSFTPIVYIIVMYLYVTKKKILLGNVDTHYQLRKCVYTIVQ